MKKINTRFTTEAGAFIYQPVQRSFAFHRLYGRDER